LLSRSMPYWRMSGHRCASHLLAKLMIIHVTILSSSFFHAGEHDNAMSYLKYFLAKYNTRLQN